MDNNLYLIIPYFDFNNSIFSKKNLDLFIDNYGDKPNLKIIICEGHYNSELPDYSNKVYKHFKYKLKNILWVKENLINLAIKQLSPDAEYIAWSDRDIYFVDPNWVIKTIEALKSNDIIQPWSEIIHTNLNNELLLMPKLGYFNFCKRSAVLQRVIQNTSGVESDNLGSTGQIWAINKNFYNKIGKLNDIEIVGGADSNIVNFCIFQDENYNYQIEGKTSPETLKNWQKYKENFKDVKYGFLHGAIIHYWHGQLENRHYSIRHLILTEGQYNPEEDIEYDENGVLCLTEKGKRLEEKIKEYFTSRSLDENILPKYPNAPFFKSYEIRQCLVPKSGTNRRRRKNMNRKNILES